jgi:hypothetical protein
MYHQMICLFPSSLTGILSACIRMRVSRTKRNSATTAETIPRYDWLRYPLMVQPHLKHSV